MKWFKHDANANTDAKLRRVRLKYGMEGYGLYWYILELISSNIDINHLSFELEHDSEVIAHDTGIHYERVQEMVAFMTNCGLLENHDGKITCFKMAKRLDQSMTGNPEFRNKIKNLILAMGSHDGVMIKNRIEENRIEENRIEKTSKKKSTEFYLESPPSEKTNKNDLTLNVNIIVELYHQILFELPKCTKITPTRRSQIIQRTREDLHTLKHWENFFSFVRKSDFLMGRKPATEGRRPFKANLEWITKLENFIKISEHYYV